MLLQFLSGTFHHLLLSSVIAKRCRILRRRKRLLPLTTLIVTGRVGRDVLRYVSETLLLLIMRLD